MLSGGLQMINYFSLQQLVAFYETSTLSRASAQLHISQPTITRTMKKIEEEFRVPLFNRTKNSIKLNENGVLAAKLAEKIINQTDEMINTVRALDKSTRTISLGSCARVPISDLINRMAMFYPETSISSEVKGVSDLLDCLENNTYQMIILPFEPASSNLITKNIGEEHLKFCIPKSHHFANKKTLSFEEMDGQSMLFYQNGFWEELIHEKMPNSHFLVQNERYSFHELIESSILPFFISEAFLPAKSDNRLKDRVIIPISNPEVHVSYYLVCKKENKNRFSVLFY